MVGIVSIRRRLPRLLWILGLILLLSACATVSEPQAPALDEELPPFQEIVYLSSGGDIRTVDRTGAKSSPVARLAALEGVQAAKYSLATWSPDGRRIAFVVTFRRGEEQTRSSLYVADSLSGSVSPIHDAGSSPPFYLYWAPDARRITFLSVDEDEETLALQIVGDSGEGYSVLGTGRPYYWAWSPSGNTIFAHVGGVNSRGFPESNLRFLTFDDGLVSTETLQLPTIAFQAPQYSPDGNYIAAAVEDPAGRRHLMLLTRNGEPLRSLALLRGQVAFSWSPDGRRIAYIDGGPAPYGGVAGRLRVVQVGAGAQTISFNGFGFPANLDAQSVGAFFWSPDGRKLAYFEPVFAQTGSGRPQLVFRMKIYSVDSGRTVTIGPFLPTASFAGQFVPYFDQYERSGTIWSPDSQFVVINAVTQEDRPGIFVVPVSGEEAPYLIAEGTFPFWAPRRP